MGNLDLLVNELRKIENENQWVEFKHNNYNPEMIGADISALANGAALHEKNCAYMIWGVSDVDHSLVGTDFDLQSLKQGNQELENWLRSMLSPNADFRYETVVIDGFKIGVLTIEKANNTPVTFKKFDYIRIGSYTKKLNEYPAIQKQLWDKLRNECFEEQYAKIDLELSVAVNYLDFSKYFELTNTVVPDTLDGVAHYLLEEDCIVKQDNGLYAITNLGAILFAKRLSDFDRLSRKAVRVVQYEGNNKLQMLKEDVSTKGYASGFEELLKFVYAVLPTREVIDGALRNTITAYPSLALREAIGNALIHQDLSVTGTGPTIEIFTNRVDITNSGTPLVDVKRIIDNPPKSRNEKLAQLMRRMRICEELGTGWDKMAISCELSQLPAPKIDLFQESTRVTLFAEIPFSSISTEDKLWACYLHACIKQVQGEQLTNASLRERFGLKESSAGAVSRLIKEAVKSGFIKPLDPSTAPRYMKYIPIWA